MGCRCCLPDTLAEDGPGLPRLITDNGRLTTAFP